MPGYKGGLVSGHGFVRGFNRGGGVQGFAQGGGVGHPRPSHISPVDTVPAWLQPGEFVIPKMRVAQFGARFFERIRRGSISPEMGQRHLSSNISRTNNVYGLAAGGIVPGPSTVASRRSGRNTIAGTNVVLPVLVADDNTVDQIIAGGRDSFDAGVNAAPVFNNPNDSNSNT